MLSLENKNTQGEWMMKEHKLHIISEETIAEFEEYLLENELADATIRKYSRELHCLMEYLNGAPVTKLLLLEYRKAQQKNNQSATVNGKISAINHYLKYYDLQDCALKLLKIQRRVFVTEEKELSEREYRRLLKAAVKSKQWRLYYLLLTICSTGIRVSEIGFVTVEAVRRGTAEIRLKGKTRIVILSKQLVLKLIRYMRRQHITSGPIFCTRSGRPMDRSNICHEMKKLSEAAGVRREKVHPHSLRHLFARSFYSVNKNIAYLADMMGHSSMETTRIYVAASAKEHERVLELMHLVI